MPVCCCLSLPRAGLRGDVSLLLFHLAAERGGSGIKVRSGRNSGSNPEFGARGERITAAAAAAADPAEAE